MTNPLTIVLCDVPPAVLKVLVIELYAVPLVVEYLHVAASFVVSDIVDEVVPALRFPEGAPLLLVGGVISDIVHEPLFRQHVSPVPQPVPALGLEHVLPDAQQMNPWLAHVGVLPPIVTG